MLASLSIRDIVLIDTLDLTFGAAITVELAWEISKLDIVDFVASDASKKWRPVSVSSGRYGRGVNGHRVNPNLIQRQRVSWTGLVAGAV